ncbi:hypothetical protein A8C75_14935 [Marinobacterium aestuarii]|uniref:Uncharacterized protein n=1 Tax=Marinobacterium aestuarii TaxID=1821621 RepID=A0A1A9F1P3_9GAMM|nr:hypothetical protein [Marinobacterium aestuarii]ANG63643.1 hypothetical protein A8C75_14935 [Marinobacterium aestuarii]
MSNDNITEWLMSLSMEELLDLDYKLKAKIKTMAQEKAAEQERLEQARLEQMRLDKEHQERQEQEAKERAKTTPGVRPLPTNLYASVDQLAASQGLDISGLMNEIARKAAQKPKPKPKTGSGHNSGNGRR